jgi:hypothetical protein
LRSKTFDNEGAALMANPYRSASALGLTCGVLLLCTGATTEACTVFDTSALTGGGTRLRPLADADSADREGDVLRSDASSADGAGPPRIADAGGSDDASPTTGLDAAARYCDGWRFCDTFDPGAPHIGWTTFSTGGNQADPSLREATAPVTGSTALRALRNGGADAIFRQFRDSNMSECEFDIDVIDTFGSSGSNQPNLVVAYFELTGAGTDNDPIGAFFRRDGIYGRKQGNGAVAETPFFVQQPTRNVWLHVGLKLIIDQGKASASEISLTAEGRATDTKRLSFAPIAYSDVQLNIGLACDVNAATPRIDAYIDNVRCR